MSSHEDPGHANRRPISTHKAFAPIVALWFAALLGLGSMVLPVELIERMVLRTGASSYLPMIAPPLDLAGRAIVAIVLALLGGAIGQVIARRLGAAHSPSTGDETVAETRAPISAYAELGDAEVEEEAPRRSRRLSVEDDVQDEQVIEFAPLPMVAALDSEAEELAAYEEATFELVTADDEELELVEEEITAQEEPALAEMDIVEADFDTWEQEPEPEFEDAPQAVEVVPEATPEPEQFQAKQITPAVSPCDDRPLEDLGLVQLVERLGASMQKHRVLRASTAVVPVRAPATQAAPEYALPQAKACDDGAEPEAFGSETPTPSFEAEREGELAAADYAAHADPEYGVEDVPADEVEVDTVEAEIEDGAGEPVAWANPEPQPAPANPFAGFASFAEEDDAEELAALTDSFRLPVGNTAPSHQLAVDDGANDAPSSDFVDDENEYEDEHEHEHELEDEVEDEEEGEDDNEVYGSLLSLRRPFPSKPVEEAGDPESSRANEEQDEEEEAAANPPAAAAPSLETKAHERALRDALVSLQGLDRAG